MITGSLSREAIALGMLPGDHDDREDQILDPTVRYELRGKLSTAPAFSGISKATRL